MKIYKRYKSGKRGGQHYHIRNYGTLSLKKKKTESEDEFFERVEKEYEDGDFTKIMLLSSPRKDLVCPKYRRKNFGAFMSKTTIPAFDFPDEYDFDVKKIMMSPQDFMEATRQESLQRVKREKGYDYLFDPKEYEKVVVSKDTERFERLKEALKHPKPTVPLGFLEYDKEGHIIGHEGRHRAVAAREIGLTQIPILEVRKKWPIKL